MGVLVKLLFVWSAIALLVLNWYSFARAHSYFALYPDIMLLAVGLPLWRKRQLVARRLQNWSRPPFVKFVLLGYGMVLFEEMFAALFNNLNEGFSPGLYVIRIGQFWAFNIIAFTPLVVGWYMLSQKLKFFRAELFILAGLWGLYAERISLTQLNILLLLAPLTALVYAVIMGPAFLSIPEPPAEPRHWFTRYLLAIPLVAAVAIPSILLLLFLRGNFPSVFPPCNFIPCL